MEKKLNVCMLTPKYVPDFSGYSIQAHRINNIIRHQGVSIRVVAQNLRSGDYPEDYGLEIIRLPSTRWLSRCHDALRLLLWTLRTSIYVWKIRKQIDVIHVLDGFYYASIFAIMSRLIRKPIVVKNTLSNGPFRSDTSFRRMRINVLRRSAHVIGISRETNQELIQLGFPTDHIHHIPNGVDTQQFRPCRFLDEKLELRSKLAMIPDHQIALYVGQIHPRKRIEVLIESCAQVIAKHQKFSLVLVGPITDHAYYEQLIQRVNDYGIADHVRFMGSQDHTSMYMQAADMFLFPSDKEGMPNALMEAMACGLPSIGQSIGGVVDLITDQVTGFLLRTPTTLHSDMEQYIELLLSNPDLSRNMGLQARSHIEQQFAIEVIAERYRLLYIQLAKEQR